MILENFPDIRILQGSFCPFALLASNSQMFGAISVDKFSCDDIFNKIYIKILFKKPVEGSFRFFKDEYYFDWNEGRVYEGRVEKEQNLIVKLKENTLNTLSTGHAEYLIFKKECYKIVYKFIKTMAQVAIRGGTPRLQRLGSMSRSKSRSKSS
jgi:hypothetical protein